MKNKDMHVASIGLAIQTERKKRRLTQTQLAHLSNTSIIAIKDEFNLIGIATTTGSATPIVIVNGPVVTQLGIGEAPGVQAAALAERDQLLGNRAKLLRLGQGGGDLLDA